MRSFTEFFRAEVGAFLEYTGMGSATLGRLAVGDPNLLRQMDAGRSPSLRMADRVRAFMANYPGYPGGERDPPACLRVGGQPPEKRRVGDTDGANGRELMDPHKTESKANPRLRILRMPEVVARTGLSRSTIYARMSEGTFPPQISLGGRAVGWLETSIDEWIRNRIAESRGGGEAVAH